METCILFVTPFLLFFINLLIKNGFRMPTETAGGDLCLVAVGVDISQMCTTMSDDTQSIELLPLLLLFFLAHLFLWASSLRLVSFGGEKGRKDGGTSLDKVRSVRIGTSYVLGLLAFCTSLGTVFQFMTRQGSVSV